MPAMCQRNYLHNETNLNITRGQHSTILTYPSTLTLTHTKVHTCTKVPPPFRALGVSTWHNYYPACLLHSLSQDFCVGVIRVCSSTISTRSPPAISDCALNWGLWSASEKWLVTNPSSYNSSLLPVYRADIKFQPHSQTLKLYNVCLKGKPSALYF